jgi:hypothetical protein
MADRHLGAMQNDCGYSIGFIGARPFVHVIPPLPDCLGCLDGSGNAHVRELEQIFQAEAEQIRQEQLGLPGQHASRHFEAGLHVNDEFHIFVIRNIRTFAA